MAHYLEHIRIARYGLLRDFDVGAFGPNLNVVYGRNEAGKSTLASFIGGVLFGWEEARGVRNTYRPPEGERSGTLLFADEGSEDRCVLSRALNEDGLKGDTNLVSDIDHATYRTMFSLSSDELRSLKNTSDVTARLLTAGSGTGSSPAAAFVEVEQRIAAITSRDEKAEGSIANLAGRLEEKRSAIDQAREENELRKQEDRERAELVESLASATARLDEMNAEIESLRAAEARVKAGDAQLVQREAEIARLEAERIEYSAEKHRVIDSSPGLMSLDVAEERSLRDSLEEYADEQAKAQRGVDIAKENSASSTAAYEALLEMGDGSTSDSRITKDRTSRTVVSVLLPLAFIAFGIPLFIHGRVIRSLSFTALGIGLVVLACFMAAAALVVLLRPNKTAEAAEGKRSDAQWVMLQDKKKLDASLAVKSDLEDEITSFLEDAGLKGANGSIRQARALLDDAHDARMRVSALDQRLASLDMHLKSARDAIWSTEDEKARVMESVGLDPTASANVLEIVIRQYCDQRDLMSKALADMNLRYGELGPRLDSALTDRSFDQLKFEYHELACRLREAKHELVTLLLAKRILEKSIAAWESRSQPEVYAQASRLFSQMTDGVWARISMTGEGRLVAIASDGVVREVRHLSLGTCQQLYLSLRVAMLKHADTVGVSIPVLADDILVNFDVARRRAAARVLADLARSRQVIVFTCHRETVDALCEADEGLTYLEL